MNPPKADELDYIHFLIAAQKVFTCTEAARSQPVDSDAPAHDTESGCTLQGMDERRDLQKTEEELESERLERLYRKASDPVERTHLFMVWRMSLGDSIGEVAQTSGYSKKWTTEIARRYEAQGVEGLGDHRHGNPGAKERALCSRRPERQSWWRLLPDRRQLRWVAGCGAGRRSQAG